jgi:hypothetical protein
MSFCELLSKFFKDIDCRKQSVVVKKDELDASVNDEKVVIEETKPLTVEEADTDNSDDDINVFEEPVSVVRNASEDTLLEFDCDERELIKILEEKEESENDQERKRFSMC